MRKYYLPVILVLTVVFNLVLSVLPIPQVAATLSPPAHIVAPKFSFAHKTLAQMTLAQKVGQTLFISIPDTYLSPSTTKFIKQIQPGGVLLFAGNISTSTQTTQLNADLQETASENDIPPFFIAVDEEGGVVERISFAPVKYSQPKLGGLGVKTAANTAKTTCDSLKDLGFNTNFAPVADVAYSANSIMASRSFGSNPATVAKFVAEVVKNFEQCGILATAKHFPGHGRTAVDSHFSIPTVNISLSKWKSTDALPFKSAIQAGTTFIMVGHLSYPAVDKAIATKSKIWIKKVLRDEMRFGGIIISDDLKMSATGGNLASTAQASLAAGSDMVVTADTQQNITKVSTTLKSYYNNPDRQKLLDEKVLRILTYKYQVK